MSSGHKPGPGDETPRRPKAFDADDPSIKVSQTEAKPSRPADEEAEGEPGDQNADIEEALAAEARGGRLERAFAVPARRFGWGAVLASTLVSLFFLALGLWFTRFVSVALGRDDWIGWLSWGLAGLAGLAAFVLAIRELLGLLRLSRLTSLRRDADKALKTGDAKLERAAVRRLLAIAGSARDMRWDVDRFREEERHMRDPGELLALADKVLLAKPDSAARLIVYESARRVAVVTAVVPIAFIVVLFVLFENLRMVRRLAASYGGRPGFLGGVRLFWWIIGHIAATGAIALTDDLWGQFFGQDVARRVSKKLGEGAFNGAMTARLGIAAIGVTRPLPYVAVKPPRVRAILVKLFPEVKPADLISGVFGRKRAKTSGEDNLRE